MAPFPLKATFGRTYVITQDPSAGIPGQSREDLAWLDVIPCRYGEISIHGPETLATYAKGRLIAGKLAAVSGVTVRQRGDSEITATFPAEVFPAVAAVLQARRRRAPSRASHLAGSRFAPATT